MLVGDNGSPPRSDQQARARMEHLEVGSIIRPSEAQSISRLPSELFVQILKEIYLLLEALPEDEQRRRHADWTNPYQLVCRRWRDVICATPQLWQEIRVSLHPEWLELCLDRCAGTLASVYTRHRRYSTPTFATIGRHASSIKVCQLELDLDFLYHFSYLFDTPMPALETLSLRQIPFEEALYVSLNFDLFPRLSTLSLISWSPPRDAAAFISLRSLTIIGTLWPSSYDHFLDVMQNAYNLEHLDLDLTMLGQDKYRDRLANLQIHRSPRKTPIILPRLQVAKLQAPNEVLIDLFASIYAPQATTLALGNNITYRANEDPNPQIARILVPVVQLGYPFLRSPHSVYLRCRDGMLELRLRSPAGSLVCFLEHQILMDDRWPTAHLGRNLLAIIDVFSVASVHALEIEGRPDRVPGHTWKRVFQGFQNLRTLHVAGRGSLDTLWHGLELATAASMKRDGAMCCPSLSEITTDDRPHTYKFNASVRLFEFLLRALRTRAEHRGGRALEKLKLHLCPSKKLYNCISADTRKGLMEDVRALVGELDYREHPRPPDLGAAVSN